MNHRILIRILLTSTLVVGSIVAARAQGVSTLQLLEPGSRCDHVIDLIMRHGVNNSVDRSAAHSLLHRSPWGAMAIPAVDLGDLEIAQVTQIAHDDAACGPKIVVTVHNRSCRQVCNFHVTAVAVLGRICPVSPSATVRVDQLEAGAAIEVVVTLPIEALAMGNRNGQVIGFQTLVVAIDSFDQLVETNEANNLKAFDVTELPQIAAGVEEAAGSVSAEATVVEPPVDQPVSENLPTGSLQADQPAEDALRSAIEQLVPEESSQVEPTVEG